jgi:hypothetical protein
MKQQYFATLASLLLSASVLAGTTPGKNGLHSFQASCEFNHNLLTWITGLSSKSHFEVEKSTDGMHWRTIAVVMETKTGAVKKYSFADEDNEEAIIYYRIRQVDIKGQSYYSSVRTVRRNTTLYRMV